MIGLLVTLVAVVTWASTIGSVNRDELVVAALSPMPRDPLAPVIYLIVGSDSRDKIESDAGDRFGPVTTTAGQRADVVMLVRFSARDRDVRILSLPRDLLVEVDGHGRQKLSATFGLGGSRLLVETTKELSGLPVHHYVELDFVGFSRMVDNVGGVWMDFPARARDVFSGLEVDAGRQLLDGDAALALVRSRNYEEWRDGTWVAVDDGDRSRIGRQHRFLRAAARGAVDGSFLTRVRRSVTLGRHVTVDARLSIGDLARLVHRMSALGLDDNDLRILPTEPVLTFDQRVSPFPPLHVGAVAYERPAQPAAAEAIHAFAAIPTEAR